jgi:ribosomal protein S6--L-glutamate ligase
MKIGILMMEHAKTRQQSVMPDVVRILTDWGVCVDLIYPEQELIDVADIRVEHDLYILKASTPLAMSMAGALHAIGATVLNPYPVAATLRDKIVTERVLRTAGVPTPETYVADRAELLAPLLAAGPLVIKPYRGSRGCGVRVVWDADELDELSTNDGPLFAQRYQKPEGVDRKIYCIGGQLFGVERVWPPLTYEDKVGRPFTVTPELRDIALRCGRAFGVDLLGLDVVISDGRPYVVDVNSFPGFKGVPDAALRLADYIFAAADRRREHLRTPARQALKEMHV